MHNHVILHVRYIGGHYLLIQLGLATNQGIKYSSYIHVHIDNQPIALNVSSLLNLHVVKTSNKVIIYNFSMSLVVEV